MKELIQKNPVCGILRHMPVDQLIPYAEALYAGGVHMFEVAMNTEGGAEQIAILNDHFAGKALVGAGTVINMERCKAAKAAGAGFFLTPSTTVSTLEFCRENDMPLLPGVMTPTDVAVCLSYGYTTMKLFPAGDLPLSYIKSLKGPFNGTEYVAVGGVTPDNIGDFFKAGFIGVGMGSNLAPKEYLKAGRYDLITQYVAQIVSKSKEN